MKKEIEGTFNGQEMVTDMGEYYPVPMNYASKSRLIEGDRLLLKIADNGDFIFKNVEPCTRIKILANIVSDDEKGQLFAHNPKSGKIYKMLTASISFFKLQPGDRVSLIVPFDHDSDFGAVDNVIN